MDADPKMTFRVTMDPGVGIPVRVVPVNTGPLTRKLAWAPGAKVSVVGAKTKVRGASVVALAVQPVGDETMQAVQAVPGVEPVSDPEMTTWQPPLAQSMADPPSFFTVTDMADGAADEVDPATRDAPTTVTLEFVVALLIRL